MCRRSRRRTDWTLPHTHVGRRLPLLHVEHVEPLEEVLQERHTCVRAHVVPEWGRVDLHFLRDFSYHRCQPSFPDSSGPAGALDTRALSVGLLCAHGVCSQDFCAHTGCPQDFCVPTDSVRRTSVCTRVGRCTLSPMCKRTCAGRCALSPVRTHVRGGAPVPCLLYAHLCGEVHPVSYANVGGEVYPVPYPHTCVERCTLSPAYRRTGRFIPALGLTTFPDGHRKFWVTHSSKVRAPCSLTHAGRDDALTGVTHTYD